MNKATTNEKKTKGSKTTPINLDLVKPELVIAHLKKYKLAENGDTAAKVVRLQDHYRRTAPRDKLAECDACGGDSDTREPTCPYCGAEGVDADIPGKEPKAQMNGASKAPVVPEAAQALVKVSGKKPEIVPAEVVGTETELNEAVERVLKAKAMAGMGTWAYANEILSIFERKLHLQRRNDKGNVKYKTWTQFCAAELGMTAGYSYKLMDIAALYTEDLMKEVGVAKLSIIAKLPPGAREEVIAKARKGMPFSKVAEEVHRLAGGDRPRRETGRTGFKGRPGKGQASARARREEASGQITVALVTGRVKVPLFARPKGKGVEPTQRAKRLADDPRGTEQLANNCERVYTVSTDSKGSLVLMVETRRKTA